MLLCHKPHSQIRCCQSSSVIIEHAAARPPQPHTALRWPTLAPSDPMAAVHLQSAGGCIFCTQFIHSGSAEAAFFVFIPPSHTVEMEFRLWVLVHVGLLKARVCFL